MKLSELLEVAGLFLQNNQNVNEVEVQDGTLRVHLIRITPAPITYPGWTWNPNYSYWHGGEVKY